MNFFGKNIELCHENSWKRRYWMSPPFTNRSPRFVKHGLSPRFPGPVRSSSVRLLQHAEIPLCLRATLETFVGGAVIYF